MTDPVTPDGWQLPDLYTVLGVTAAASNDELQHAFRSLVRQHHPDTRSPTPAGPDADVRLQQIITAYETLRDPVSRAAYDRTRPGADAGSSGRTWQPPSPAAPPTSAPIRLGTAIHVEPAIRVGPVRWEPPPPRTERGT
jgi:curved DNA-binding protein CbpA